MLLIGSLRMPVQKVPWTQHTPTRPLLTVFSGEEFTFQIPTVLGPKQFHGESSICWITSTESVRIWDSNDRRKDTLCQVSQRIG